MTLHLATPEHQQPWYWLWEAWYWPSNIVFHAWRRHQMENFPRDLPFVRGIHRSPVNSPHKGQWSGALMVFFNLRLNKRLSKQSRGWWFETPWRSLWRHCNGEFRQPERIAKWWNTQIYFYVLDINSALQCLYKLWPAEPTEGNRFFMNNNNAYSDPLPPYKNGKIICVNILIYTLARPK